MSRVVVGFLHRADSLAPLFRKSLTMLLMADAKARQRVLAEVDQESSANISAGRCAIVERFLAYEAADWLWMLDSDMTFDAGILERLLRSADAERRPIMGGLCFGCRPKTHNGQDIINAEFASPLEAFPTIYDERGGGLAPRFDYERDAVQQCDSTGAACLLIHRRVLADRRWRLGADGKPDGHPHPWFREAVWQGKPMSEDHFFCLKARRLGYPIHVDAGARTGHVKPQVVDEAFYDANRPRLGKTFDQFAALAGSVRDVRLPTVDA